ncbi:MAG: DedA family protein [Candidatus Omnitrophica bacterium]|nr:DedA family protein [Candidatus Omnitrophota bacterium]
MDIIKQCLDFFIHLDSHIGAVAAAWGLWTYALLFLIIFCETGLVVLPLLPGDSLLFVLGALAAKGVLRVDVLWASLAVAAALGDAVNYSVGAWCAPKIFSDQHIRFLKTKHLEKTKKFYAKYGNKTIILARFVPIIRTFAPFLAGVGAMPYRRFALYNITGGILWVSVGLGAGHLFGGLPFVAKNFSWVVLAIVVVSLVPAVWEYINHRELSSHPP